jgi:hypothetical protein
MFATNLQRFQADKTDIAKTNGSLALSSMAASRPPMTKSANPTKHSSLVRLWYNASNPELSHSKDGRAIPLLKDSGLNATTCPATTRNTTTGAPPAVRRDVAQHSWSTSVMRARVAAQSFLCWNRRKMAGGVSLWIVTTAERASRSSLGRAQLCFG